MVRICNGNILISMRVRMRIFVRSFHLLYSCFSPLLLPHQRKQASHAFISFLFYLLLSDKTSHTLFLSLFYLLLPDTIHPHPFFFPSQIFCWAHALLLITCVQLFVWKFSLPIVWPSKSPFPLLKTTFHIPSIRSKFNHNDAYNFLLSSTDVKVCFESEVLKIQMSPKCVSRWLSRKSVWSVLRWRSSECVRVFISELSSTVSGSHPAPQTPHQSEIQKII